MAGAWAGCYRRLGLRAMGPMMGGGRTEEEESGAGSPARRLRPCCGRAGAAVVRSPPSRRGPGTPPARRPRSSWGREIPRPDPEGPPGRAVAASRRREPGRGGRGGKAGAAWAPRPPRARAPPPRPARVHPRTSTQERVE